MRAYGGPTCEAVADRHRTGINWDCRLHFFSFIQIFERKKNQIACEILV